MRARVQGATAYAGFDPAKLKADRPIALDDQDSPRRGSGLFLPRRAMLLGQILGPGLGCGLGAGQRAESRLQPWAVGRLRCSGPKWPNTVKCFLFYFPETFDSYLINSN